MDTNTRSQPKRHHFVPKFYLRNFADHKRRIRMYERGPGRKSVSISVNNAAVESGFYTIVDESGQESTRVEQLLSTIEHAGKASIDRIVRGSFPPTPEDRSDLAILMAVQILRTPEQRRQHEAAVDYTEKIFWEGWTPEHARERLRQKVWNPPRKPSTPS